MRVVTVEITELLGLLLLIAMLPLFVVITLSPKVNWAPPLPDTAPPAPAATPIFPAANCDFHTGTAGGSLLLLKFNCLLTTFELGLGVQRALPTFGIYK